MKKMTSQNFSWDDLKTVMAVGEHGNLSRAADALGINHSPLFRRLGAIETSLALAWDTALKRISTMFYRTLKRMNAVFRGR